MDHTLLPGVGLHLQQDLSPDSVPAFQQNGMMELPLRLEAPCFHVAPESGWLNDPNGPLYYNGAYHMFFQHLPGSAVWGFNLVWGHAASKDLVHWELLPHAIQPDTIMDGDGCFSGCAVIDEDGTPALLYTGVRLRGSLFGGLTPPPLPPPEYDLGLPFIESQCLMYAEDPKGDWRLPYWRKHGVPFLTLPPPDVKLAGWRDPYIVGPPTGHPEHGWTMLIGSGIKEEGGTVLVYRSRNLKQGWQLVGELCSGVAADATGVVWECPLLVKLPILSGGLDSPGSSTVSSGDDDTHSSLASSSSNGSMHNAGLHHSPRMNGGAGRQPGMQHAASRSASQHQQEHRRRYFFCISPDACTNPTLYYLGDYVEVAAGQSAGSEVAASTTRADGPALPATPGTRQSKFLIKEALGPFRLDLGDVLYAPNTLIDEDKGRILLWAWMQEARKVAGNHMYAGCLSCPRELWVEYGDDHAMPRLVQRPVAELRDLRKLQGCWVWPPPGKQATEPSRQDVQHAEDLHVEVIDDVHVDQKPGRKADAPAGADAAVGPGQEAALRTTTSVSQASAIHFDAVKAQASPFGLASVQSIADELDFGLVNVSMTSMTRSQALMDAIGAALSPTPGKSPSKPAKPTPSSALKEPTTPSGTAPSLLVGPGQSYRIPQVAGSSLDLELQLALVWPDNGMLSSLAPPGQQTEQLAGLSRRASSTITIASQLSAQQQAGEAPPAPSSTTDDRAGFIQGMGRAGDQSAKTVAPVPEGACSGVVLRSWQAGVEGAAAVLYCWSNQVLEVVFEALDPETHEFSLASPNCRRVGAKLQHPPAPGEPLQLRLLLDYSLLEVFTGAGEVLSTRVYRGTPPVEEGCGIDLVSLSCTTQVVQAAAYEMKGCWINTGPLPVPARQPELAAQLSGMHLAGFSPAASDPVSRAISRAASMLLGRMSDAGTPSPGVLSRRTSRFGSQAGDATPPPEPDTGMYTPTMLGSSLTHVAFPGYMTAGSLSQQPSMPIPSPRYAGMGTGTPPHPFLHPRQSIGGNTPPHPLFMQTGLPLAASQLDPSSMAYANATSTNFEVGSPTAAVLQSAVTTLAAATAGVPVTYLPPRHSTTLCGGLGSGRITRAASIEIDLGDELQGSGSLPRGSPRDMATDFLEHRSSQPQVVASR